MEIFVFLNNYCCPTGLLKVYIELCFAARDEVRILGAHIEAPDAKRRKTRQS